jgi:UMF1 family MFS transporter
VSKAPSSLTRSEKAWIYIDVANSAFATSILATLFPIFFSKQFPDEGVNLFGWVSSGLAVWGYAVSASAIGTLILSIFIGSWADRVGARRLCFLMMTLLGSVGTMALAFLTGWEQLILCFMLANIGFAGSYVFSNSLLKFATSEDRWDAISLKGFAWGYIAGGLMLALNLLLVMKWEWFGFASSDTSTRLCFLLVGIHWLLWSLPAYFRISESKEVEKERLSFFVQARSLGKTISQLPKRPMLVLFILSYFFSNEGIQTVISMASPYAEQTLGLNQIHIIGTFLVIQIVSWPLTLGMTKLSARFGAMSIFRASLAFWMMIVGFAFFMKSSLHFLILGLMVALVLGASQALPRSLYARLIPHGQEAEFYSLYGLSGRTTPILGPLLFGLVSDWSANDRWAIFSLGLFFALSLIPLYFVSIRRV